MIRHCTAVAEFGAAKPCRQCKPCIEQMESRDAVVTIDYENGHGRIEERGETLPRSGVRTFLVSYYGRRVWQTVTTTMQAARFALRAQAVADDADLRAIYEHGERSFPHPGGCEHCRAARMCNACGAGLLSGERCTNGRCAKCHQTVCTPGGATSPGHGYGDVPSR